MENICTGPAATVYRQNLLNTNSLETRRRLRHRYSIPAYLTKLLKATLDENKFEEAFAQWEDDLQWYEQNNGTPLPQRDKGSTTTTLTTQRHNSHNTMRSGPSSWNTTVQHQHSWECRERPAQQQATTKVQHQWIQERHTKDARAKAKEEKAKARAKEKAARATTIIASTTAKAKERKGGKEAIGQGNPFKRGMTCVLQMPQPGLITHSNDKAS